MSPITPPPSQSRLSTRISLRWPPAPTFENTDTIVMSVAGWYVDLRVDQATKTIDWAIAGQRVVDSNDSTRVQFTHELDSRNSFDDVDCGTFSTLPNGDDLEKGSMPRADLPGKPVCEYEEVWRELEFRRGPEGAGRGVSWVLESQIGPDLQDGEEGEVTRTFLGRVWGTYLALRQVQKHVQSPESNAIIVKDGEKVSALREEWDPSKRWCTKYSLGPKASKLPSMKDIFEPQNWKTGQTVTIAGVEYILRAFEGIPA
ncbi:uncharacterized protein BP01DRAFT_297853 [Aspergillus saccharolyticus JOP 1030-1]|uniref:Protein HRI1 n=1 Tax=Aspergillus saccharolyticus JOP 1030-1 TaxID=1450539 RepID=A0A318ZDS1_9EURO|nr:hypothetical protein BP01DRAFT_297853 [Aspergillus saccharolyticus JOP 1030-1]PYH44737.1 hypothetical protein BP01DRAFT_297853 [Aspergillus saccharolyticus JOP 1030-1]